MTGRKGLLSVTKQEVLKADRFMVRPGVSVVICCHNSAARINETLRHLAAQRVRPDIHWEVIIVNNNSTDDTRDVAAKIWSDQNCEAPLFIEDEPMAGLSYARKKGIASAHYDVVIFCDDDNWLEDTYICRAFDGMREVASAAVIGGIGEPLCEVAEPVWFGRYAANYATGSQSEVSSADEMQDITDHKGYCYGAGAVFRKSALDELSDGGFQSILKDRTGNLLLSGGDNELCYALKLRGHRIYHDPKLKFRHFIPKERLTVRYLLKLNEGFEYSYILLQPYIQKMSGKTVPRYKQTTAWMLGSMLRSFITKDLPAIIFDGKMKDFDFRIHMARRKGAMRVLWRDGKLIRDGYKFIDKIFK
jgi:glycosyltransferase involved in cell wall biosynthesis